ncbi:hypothetical protein NDU88_008400 [Pleurodeles waltl]|uniref:Uncharacterized protein n=1 Tax=Pleurodeles waltl TaxID=8319 RepID=A0AAV7N913_PLEWA|nr:hypothetical protein NDU88_008400 [Pleurodeles waltl]
MGKAVTPFQPIQDGGRLHIAWKRPRKEDERRMLERANENVQRRSTCIPAISTNENPENRYLVTLSLDGAHQNISRTALQIPKKR